VVEYTFVQKRSSCLAAAHLLPVGIARKYQYNKYEAMR
jgi:hypothetical protein